MPVFYNADGLRVKYGPSEGVAGAGGEYRTLGPNREEELIINLATLTNTATYIDQDTSVGRTAFIESVEIETLVTATSGGSATLSVGLKQSDQTTNISDTALVNALALATFAAAGTKVILTVGSTGAGSSIGVKSTVVGLATAKWNTAAFTAGKIAIRIRYNFLLA